LSLGPAAKARFFMNGNKQDYRSWLHVASEDLAAACDLARTDHHAMACFHAQQCAEKTLKAVMISVGREDIHTHHLLGLLTSISEHFPQFDQFREKIKVLEGYYIATRYPNGMRESEQQKAFQEQDSQAAIDTAKEMLDVARTLLAGGRRHAD